MKYFPIQTETSCRLKWAWSTLYLNYGTTSSCHRTSTSGIDVNNFASFHNTPIKITDREAMLSGQWPDNNCAYCKDIESAGGISDRIRQNTIANVYPPELNDNQNLTSVDPVILEVYFSSACNLSCLYCNPWLSSTINAENLKYGDFNKGSVTLKSIDNKFKDLVPLFWEWFPINFKKLMRFHMLGGEPLIQKELDTILDLIENNPNNKCEFNIVTNLMIPLDRLQHIVNRFKILIESKKLKRFDITCSIDCWGPQQEYVRYGMNLNQFENNFKWLLTQKWLTININQTISALTIKTMPELLTKLSEWQQEHKIGHWFGAVDPHPIYMKADNFSSEFNDDIITIMEMMPRNTEEDCAAYDYMSGILNKIVIAEKQPEMIDDLVTYLNEIDRRRGTNWKLHFPWIEKYVV